MAFGSASSDHRVLNELNSDLGVYHKGPSFVSAGMHSLACRVGGRGLRGWSLSAGFVPKPRDSLSLGARVQSSGELAKTVLRVCSLPNKRICEASRAPPCTTCGQIGGLRTCILLKRNPVLGGNTEHHGDGVSQSHFTGEGCRLLHTVRQQLLTAAPHADSRAAVDSGLGPRGLVRSLREPLLGVGGCELRCTHRGGKGCP